MANARWLQQTGSKMQNKMVQTMMGKPLGPHPLGFGGVALRTVNRCLTCAHALCCIWSSKELKSAEAYLMTKANQALY